MGGAFDPVHYGHLRTAVELHELLQLGEVRLIPSANPPHRLPHLASNASRLEMLSAAVAGMPWCSVDDREIRRAGPSWSVVTLEELRAESGDRSLCMILGMDAFLGLASWHRWQEILGLAHLVVARRPGWPGVAEDSLSQLISERETLDVADLHSQPAGRIIFQEVTQLDISSSAIRAAIACGHEARYLLPDCVLEIISATGCYGDSASKDKLEQGINAKQ
jgi:nicotinate-nucleotide adenylyltransferase